MRWPRVLRATGAFLVAGLLFGTAAHAQNGVITGTVSDASSKQPAPDVVVTATSPNLQGEQVVVTDANGAYRIPQLPPGNYALRFEKESFQPYSRSGIQLRVDRTIRVNVEMLPTGIQQDIVVVGTNPTIDVGSTSTGVNVGADFVRQIAVANPSGRGGSARSFESLADIAPGANADTYGVSVSGTTSPENQFIVDGLSVNDPAFGINATPLSVEFVQDVNVITGGYMPEYGRATGGVFNAVTKSGSNEFHGSVFGTWTPGALEGNAKDITVAGASLTANTTLHNIGDFGADLGGPILQDKLWFYVGVNPSFTRNNVTRTTNQLRLCTTAEIASGEGRCNRPVASGGSRITSTYQDEFGQDVAIPIEGAPEYARYADSRTFQYIGKLTYLVNQDHNLSLSVSGTPTKAGSETAYGFDLQSGANFQGVNGTFGAVNTVDKNNPLDIALKSASSFADKRILLDTTVGWHHQTASTLPVDETTPGSGEGLAATSLAQYRRINTRQSIIDFSGTGDFNAANDAVIAACEAPIPGFVAGTTPGTLPGQTAADWRCPMGATFSVGGPGFIRDDTLDRYQAKSILTYLLNAGGRHVLKGGVDFEYMTFDGNKAYSGGRFLSERGVIPGVADGGYWLELRNYSFASGTGATDLQYPGSLETSQTSATIGGFVQDSWSILDSFTLNAGLRYDAQTLKGSDDRTALAFPNQFSPRVGVIYDFTGQGRSKIFANYARYYEQVPLNLVERGFPGETSTQAGRYKTVDGAAGGAVACDPKTNFAACADPANLVNGFGLINPYAFPLGGGGTTYVDPDIKPQSSDEFSAGAEYEIFANARFGASYIHRSLGNVVEDMSRDEGATYFIGNPGEGIASEFPKAKRNYDAVTVYLDKSFADQWLANISYTYSKLRGNYAGLFRAENGQLDPNINSTFDITSLLANQDGPLPGDRPHAVKVYLAREFALTDSFSFNLGGTYRGRSGTPLNTLGGHPLYGPNEAYILPRGTAGRMPWRNEVDARVGLNYKLSQASMVTVGLDVFNVFNFQTVTNQDQSYTLQNVRPVPNGSNDDLPGNVLGYTSGTPISPSDVNPNYLQPTAYQAPRTMRVTAKVTF